MNLQISKFKQIFDASLAEDYGIKGDITSSALIESDRQVNFSIITREDIVLSGIEIAKYYFDNYSSIKYSSHNNDGNDILSGTKIFSGSGLAREILMLERVMLNYLQHLSGIATLTKKFVQKIQETKVKIFDTRKTIPIHRAFQKYAVLCGGGYNHRLSLDSSILIKDNHIAICGSIEETLKRAKKYTPHYAKIEIECDRIEQVGEALKYGADIIMLDNMNIDEINKSVQLINERAIIEVSGNVSYENISEIARTGVDMISIGKITHSAPAVDMGLDIT